MSGNSQKIDKVSKSVEGGGVSPKSLENLQRGRTRGARNIRSKELTEIIERTIPMKERVKLVAELARGITVQEDQKGGPKVYTRPPMLEALNWLEVRVTGNPPSKVEQDVTFRSSEEVMKHLALLSGPELIRVGNGDFSPLLERGLLN